MPNVEYESQFARTFIDPIKQDRFLQIAGARRFVTSNRPKAMKRWASYSQMLSNLEHWLRDDVRRSSHRASDVEAGDIRVHLAHLGAPANCHVMSLSSLNDGRNVPLVDAVSELSDGDGQSALLICLPESLAYYWHGEVAAGSAILQMART